MFNRYRINYRQSYYSAYEWYYVERRKWWFWWEEIDYFKTYEKALEAKTNWEIADELSVAMRGGPLN